MDLLERSVLLCRSFIVEVLHITDISFGCLHLTTDGFFWENSSCLGKEKSLLGQYLVNRGWEYLDVTRVWIYTSCIHIFITSQTTWGLSVKNRVEGFTKILKSWEVDTRDIGMYTWWQIAAGPSKEKAPPKSIHGQQPRASSQGRESTDVLPNILTAKEM